MGNQIAGLKARTSREEILNELAASRQRNNVVGLFISGDDEMLTTSVTKIEDGPDDEKKIYVQATDLHGYPIGPEPIPLSGIRSLIPFKTLFNDPVYVRIRERKSRHENGQAA